MVSESHSPDGILITKGNGHVSVVPSGVSTFTR